MNQDIPVYDRVSRESLSRLINKIIEATNIHDPQQAVDCVVANGCVFQKPQVDKEEDSRLGVSVPANISNFRPLLSSRRGFEFDAEFDRSVLGNQTANSFSGKVSIIHRSLDGVRSFQEVKDTLPNGYTFTTAEFCAVLATLFLDYLNRSVEPKCCFKTNGQSSLFFVSTEDSEQVLMVAIRKSKFPHEWRIRTFNADEYRIRSNDEVFFLDRSKIK